MRQLLNNLILWVRRRWALWTHFTPPAQTETTTMPSNPILDSLAAQVAESTAVMSSATILINGFAARMQAAVDAALANGATAEQLAPVQAEITALNDSSDNLAAAVAANTTPPAEAEAQ